MKKHENLIYGAVGLAALFLILVAVNYLITRVPSRIGDLTRTDRAVACGEPGRHDVQCPGSRRDEGQADDREWQPGGRFIETPAGSLCVICVHGVQGLFPMEVFRPFSSHSAVCGTGCQFFKQSSRASRTGRILIPAERSLAGSRMQLVR